MAFLLFATLPIHLYFRNSTTSALNSVAGKAGIPECVPLYDERARACRNAVVDNHAAKNVDAFPPFPPDASPASIINQLRLEVHHWKTLHHHTFQSLVEERISHAEERKARQRQIVSEPPCLVSVIRIDFDVALCGELKDQSSSPNLLIGGERLQKYGFAPLQDLMEQLLEERGVVRRRVTNQ